MNTKTAKPTTTQIARELNATTTTREQAVALVSTLTVKQLRELARNYDAATSRGMHIDLVRDAVVNATWGERNRLAGMVASLAAYNGNAAALMNLRMVGAR